jgi:polyhydroxyalkanoate synthesis regulator phasin
MDYEKNKTLAILKQMVADGKITQADAEKYCPEIAESEDEQIRKKLIEVLVLNIKGAESQMQNCSGVDRTFEIKACKKGIVWLEKQGEQKSTDKVEPKFKVGDKVKSIIDGFECTIESIDNICYYGDTTNFDIQDQDGWELVEQKPAWSEEDDRILYNVLSYIGYVAGKRGVRDDLYKEAYNWLKFLKDRCTWKPSKEQITVLHDVAAYIDNSIYPNQKDILVNLYLQLKKLREE